MAKLLQSLKQNVETKLVSLDPKYKQPKFIDYLFSPIEKSTNLTLEASKLIRGLDVIAPAKWKEWIQEKMDQMRRATENLLTEKYGEYAKAGGDKYKQFIFSKMETNPNQAREIHEALMKAESKVPPGWAEFLSKHLEKPLLERLEKVRRDPQFPQYFQYKKTWIERWKQACTQKPIKPEEQKSLMGHSTYIATLEREVYDAIMKQIYLIFEEPRNANLFKYLEKDLDDFKKMKEQNLAAKESQAKEQAAKEQAARDQAAREQAAREQAARDAREQAMREQQAREAREQAARDQAAREQAARDQAAREAREQAIAKEKAMRDQAARDQAMAREQAAREARDQAAMRDQMMRDQNARDSRNMQDMNYMNNGGSSSQMNPQGVPNYMNKSGPQKPGYHQNPGSLHPMKGQQDPSMNPGVPRQKEQYPPHHQMQSSSHQSQTHQSQQLHPPNLTPSHHPYSSNSQPNHQPNYHQPNTMMQSSHDSSQAPSHNSLQAQPTINSQHNTHNTHSTHNPHPPSHSLAPQYPLQSPSKPGSLQSPAQPLPKTMNQGQMPPNSHMSGSNQYQNNHQSPQTMPSRQPGGQMQPPYNSQNPAQNAQQPISKSSNQALPSSQTGMNPNQMSSASHPQKSHYPNNYQYPPQSSQQGANTDYPNQGAHKMPPQPVQPQQHPAHNPPQVQPQAQHPVQNHSQQIQGGHRDHQNHRMDPKRGKIIEKEKFSFNYNFDNISIEDGERRLGDVYRRLKNPFGNYEIIDRFVKGLCAELNELDLQEKVEKKMRTNPAQVKEVNMLSTNPKPAQEQPVPQKSSAMIPESVPLTIFDAQIQDIKRDDRFKVEEKGSFQNAPFMDLTVYKGRKIIKVLDGVPSPQFKAVFRLFKDAETKIKILEIANSFDFYMECQDQLNDPLIKGRLKQILEIWLEFIDKCSMKADAKLNALDELFDFE